MSKELDKKFEEQKEKLENNYKFHPEDTIYELDILNRRLDGTYKNEIKEEITVNNIFNGVNIKILAYVIFGAIVLLLGFTNLRTYGMYLFGFVFFIAGFLIGTNVEGFGLIFLFSHGGIGILSMIGALLGVDEALEIFSTMPKGGIYYLIFSLAIIIIAFIYTVIYNMSKQLQKSKYGFIIPLILILIGLILFSMNKLIIPIVAELA